MTHLVKTASAVSFLRSDYRWRYVAVFEIVLSHFSSVYVSKYTRTKIEVLSSMKLYVVTGSFFNAGRRKN